MRALVTGIVFSERYESACANCRNVAHDFRLLKAVIEVNNKQQLLLIEKAKVINMNKKRIAVLGAAFKPNTDDIRDAPSLL